MRFSAIPLPCRQISIRLLSALGLVPILIGCAGQAGLAPRQTNLAETSPSCRPERAELDRAGEFPLPASEAALAPLTRSLQGLAGAADRVAAAYAALESCRFEAADEVRQAVASGTMDVDAGNARIDGERRQFLRDLTAAVSLSDQIQGRASIELRAADRLMGGAAESLGANALPARSDQGFVAIEPAEVHLRADERSPVVARIRKGLRVESTERDGQGSWLPIALNDGSTAWVELNHLRAVPQNPSSRNPAARAASAQATIGDPALAAGLAARLTLPRRDDALARRLMGGAEAAAFAFALIPSTGGDRIANLAAAP